MKFSKILSDILLDNGLKQTELAKKIKVKPSQVSEWLRGKANPGYETLIAMSTALGVSADYLLGLEDDFGVRSAPTAEWMGDTAPYSSEERELIKKYRELNAPGKKLINTTISTLLDSSAESGKNKNKIS